MSDWLRVKSIFEALVEMPPAARLEALNRSYGDDAALRESVNELLAAHELAGAFLESPTMHGIACEAALLSGLANQPALSRVGSYTLLEVIGEGGFGAVYRARQEEPVRRTVAVKVIKPGMDSREVIARFEGERQALAMMNHPNIAAVLDGGATEQGRPYFVMEFVPGEPITTYCGKRGLDLRARLELFIQVCHAVQHAHQKGIIHRDIKPSNVLVAAQDSNGQEIDATRDSIDSQRFGTLTPSDPRPRLKVIDFGVAKATNQRLTEHSIFTQQGALIGTPAYMSPEQADTSQLDIDTRTDVYALGVLLYELLTETLPFDPKMLLSKGQSEVQRIIREVEPPRPSTRLHALSTPRQTERRQSEPRPSGSARRENQPSLFDGREPARTERPPLPDGRGADSIPDRRALIKRVRGDLDWIVMKCLEKDRARRYDTANELALEIQRYLSHQPVLAGPPTMRYRLKKLARRNRAAFVAIAGVAAALLIGITLSVAGFIAALHARDDAREQGRRAEQSAVDAQRSAHKADAVNEFLQEMLAAADPKNSARREITVREALDRAVEKLDAGSMKEQPDVEAAVRLTVGRTYAELARYDAALRQVEIATDFYGTAAGATSVDYAKALVQRGTVHQFAGRSIKAEFDFRAALTILRDRGAESALIASCLNDLASSLTSLKQFDDAKPLFEEAIVLARLPENNDQPALGEALNNLALLHNLKFEWDAAEPLLRETLEVNRRVLGEVHPNNATALDNLAMTLQGKGDMAGAKQAFRAALALRRQLYGSDHPDVATSLHNLAFLLHALNDTAGAESALQESLAIFRRIHGPAHADTLTVAESLVNVIGGRGAFDEAEAILLETLEAIHDQPDVPSKRSRDLTGLIVRLYDAWDKPEKVADWTRQLEQLQAAAEQSANSPSPASQPSSN